MNPDKRLAFTGVLLVLFLSSLNLTVVGTVLPKVVAELGGMNLYAWAFTSYSLATTISIPIFGRLSDIYSRRNILLIGIVLFAIGSTLIGLVQSMPQLILLRGLQGIGGGILMSMSIAALADIFEPRERSKYQGLTGSVYGLSSVVGPLVGGFLADQVGWRWVFPLNLPFAIVSFWFIARFLPKNPAHENTHIDYLGAALLTGALLPLLVGLSMSGSMAWSSPWVWGQLLLGSGLLAAFIWWQHRSPGPILEPALFKNKVFAISTLAMLLSTAGLYAAILYLPLYMQSVKGMSASASGMVLSPLMLGMVLTSTLAGWLIARNGRYKTLILMGLVLMTLTLWAASHLGPGSSLLFTLGIATLLGCGLGPVNPVFNLIVQLAVPPQEIGAATGGLRFFNQIGGTLGATLFGLLMTRDFVVHQETFAVSEAVQLPVAVQQALSGPDVLTNATLLNGLQQQLQASHQVDLLQQVLAGLRSLMSLSLDHIFLLAALFSGLAFFVTLRLPGRLLQEEADPESDPVTRPEAKLQSESGVAASG